MSKTRTKTRASALAIALTVVAGGGMPGMAKPLKGFGSGVLELALHHRGDAYRVVYALQGRFDVDRVQAADLREVRRRQGA